MRTLDDEEEQSTDKKGGAVVSTSQQPAWMRLLLANCKEWLVALPSVRSLDIRVLLANVHSENYKAAKAICRKSRSPAQVFHA